MLSRAVCEIEKRTRSWEAISTMLDLVSEYCGKEENIQFRHILNIIVPELLQESGVSPILFEGLLHSITARDVKEDKQ